MIVFVLILDWGNGDEEIEGVYSNHRFAQAAYAKCISENGNFSPYNPPRCDIREFKVDY